MISAKISSCEFVGSFYTLDQLPRSRRPQIALAGRSNVGKSSLLNRLVGRKNIAKVSTTPGKTRALNFFTVNDTYHLVDLPGYGFAKISKSIREEWGKMIETYLNEGRDLIGLVLLLDCRRDPTPEDHQLLEWLAARQIPTLIAVTKTDKITRDKTNRKVAQVEREFGVPAIPISSVTGAGKSDLIGAIHTLVNEHLEHRKG